MANVFKSNKSIALKFGTEFDRVTADTLETFKIKKSESNDTAWRNVKHHNVVKHDKLISQERIGWPTWNLVKIISVYGAQHVIHVQVH